MVVSRHSMPLAGIASGDDMTRTQSLSTARLAAVAAAATATVLCALALSAGRAGATGYLYDGSLERGYAIAESRYGNGTVRGRVRPTDLGPQVQTPGGNWVYCRRSCSETLRVETVDFWESQQNYGGGLAAECGLFGCLEIGVDLDRRRW